MDPNNFHLDYERLTEVLLALIVISMFVERTLSVLYESSLFKTFIQIPVKFRGQTFTLVSISGLKELIAFLLAMWICVYWDFDALSIILASKSETTYYGSLLTAGIIAGGSKISLALFHDVLGIMSSAEKQQRRR